MVNRGSDRAFYLGDITRNINRLRAIKILRPDPTVVDPGNSVAESDETNNTKAAPKLITII